MGDSSRMEQDQAQKHVCRLRKRSFSSEKVLEQGHAALNHVKEEVQLNKCKMGFDVNEHSGYGLRESPRKSSKFTSLNSTAPSIQERVCEICGREFKSKRALFGHLRHCDQKKKIHCEDCGKGFLSLRALIGHTRMHKENLTVSKETGTSSRCNLFVESLSETETMNLVRRRMRSSRVKSKISLNSSLSSLNGSSSITETVDDVEEAAKCLIMISMGLQNWDEFNSACELKGHNSESSEIKQIAMDGNAVFDGVRPPEMKKQRVEKSDPKLYDESEFVSCEAEVEKVIHDGMKWSYTTVESGDQLKEDVLDVTGLESMKLGENSCRKIQCLSPDSEILDDSRRRDEFQCNYCDKTFRTHQALGGHQTLHRKPKNTVALEVDKCSGNSHGEIVPETYVITKATELEGTENSMEQEIDGVIVINNGSVDIKVYKCPICFKEFASGQALGGHKRSHSAKNSGTSEEQIAQKKQELSDMSCMLDLNMSATLQEEASDNLGMETTSRMSQ